MSYNLGAISFLNYKSKDKAKLKSPYNYQIIYLRANSNLIANYSIRI